MLKKDLIGHEGSNTIKEEQGIDSARIPRDCRLCMPSEHNKYGSESVYRFITTNAKGLFSNYFDLPWHHYELLN